MTSFDVKPLYICLLVKMIKIPDNHFTYYNFLLINFKSIFMKKNYLEDESNK